MGSDKIDAVHFSGYGLRKRKKINYSDGIRIIRIVPPDDSSLDVNENIKRARFTPKKRIKSEATTPSNDAVRSLKSELVTPSVDLTSSPIVFDDDEPEDFYCLYCDFGAVPWSKMKRHERKFHPLRCAICMMDLLTKEALKEHNTIRHGSRCKICRKDFHRRELHEKMNYLHYCIQSADQRVYNEMIKKFDLQIEPKPDPVYLGRRRNVQKYTMCEQRTVHESAVILHIGRMADKLKKEDDKRIEEAKRKELNEMSKNVVNSNKFVLDSEAAEYAANLFVEKNIDILRNFGFIQNQNVSDPVDNYCNSCPVFQLDVTGERPKPNEPPRSSFEDGWNFDDYDLYGLPEAQAAPLNENLGELDSQDKTFMNMDTGREESAVVACQMMPITYNDAFVPNDTCDDGKV